jgi:hypothetical protein
VPHQKARRGAGSVIMPSTLPLRTDSSSHACERADLATRKLLVSRTWMRDHPDVDSSGIQAAFDDVFDQAIVFHGFADYMRDYEVFIYATADPRTGIRPEHLRYRFTHCVRATVTSALPPRSGGDHLTSGSLTMNRAATWTATYGPSSGRCSTLG